MDWKDLGEQDKVLPLAREALAIYDQIEHPSAEKVRKMIAEWEGEE